MSGIIGSPAAWAGLLEPMLPDILQLVLDCWVSMPVPEQGEGEDDITVRLCLRLKHNRTARNLPFQIDTQMVELEPAEGNETGRMDITFRPLIPREDIYFCLEGKLLNVIKNDRRRALASEYVKQGMMRFISGKYARAVLHGGMAGYILDGDTTYAITRVSASIKKHCATLGMEPTQGLVASSVIGANRYVRETAHKRKGETFLIHHLFLAVAVSV